MSLIVLEQGLGKTINIVIVDADGAIITPGASDLVRIRIGRTGQDDVFTLTSGSPTAAGSQITPGGTNVVRFDAEDLANIDPGVYTMWVEYYDAADALEWKLVEAQVVHIKAIG